GVMLLNRRGCADRLQSRLIGFDVAIVADECDLGMPVGLDERASARAALDAHIPMIAVRACQHDMDALGAVKGCGGVLEHLSRRLLLQAVGGGAGSGCSAATGASGDADQRGHCSCRGQGNSPADENHSRSPSRGRAWHARMEQRMRPPRAGHKSKVPTTVQELLTSGRTLRPSWPLILASSSIL